MKNENKNKRQIQNRHFFSKVSFCLCPAPWSDLPFRPGVFLTRLYKTTISILFKHTAMTEKEKQIEQGFTDLQEWMLPLQKQFKETRDLNDSQSKLLYEVRDLAKGIKPVIAPVPKSNPTPNKPRVFYMEMGFADLFGGLDGKQDSMTEEHRHSYNQLRRLFEEDGHSGVTLPYDAIDFLRKAYGTYCFKRV